MEVNDKENEKLTEFKSRVKDLILPHHDDYYLLKWLKARSFDVRKAERMFRDSMALRKKMSVDQLLEHYVPPRVVQEYFAGGFCGFDKEGSPVFVERYGYLDFRGLMCATFKSDLEKKKLLDWEFIVKKAEEQSKRLGKRVDGLTVIFDMENVGSKQMWRPGLKMYMHLVKMLEDNYPEMMKQLLVVNAPRIFPILWKVGRPLVSENMKKKIKILGADYKETLKNFIDPDNIPAYLGGTLTDPDGDPFCKTMICYGGIVPASYYMWECEQTEGTHTTVVPNGQQLEIAFFGDVGTLVRWEFRTEGYDIAFGVQYRNDNKKQNIIDIHRVNSHQILQDGSFVCEQTGTHVIIFDNHYSWTRNKVLHYLIEFYAPDESLRTEIDQMSYGGR